MAEPGENWLGERFGERPDKLRDGWELPRGWIDQVPNKGFIELVYFTSAKQVWIVTVPLFPTVLYEKRSFVKTGSERA